MTPERLAELEMHLAAGTDLSTALAAVDGQPPKPIGWFPWALALAVVLLALWFCL